MYIGLTSYFLDSSIVPQGTSVPKFRRSFNTSAKIGIIKSPDRGSHSGCYYWQSDRTTKKLETNYSVARKKIDLLIKNAGKTGVQSTEYSEISEELEKSINLLKEKAIFSSFDENKPKMNFNGIDTLLNLISEKRITDIKNQQTYKDDKTVIKLTTIST